MLEYLKKNGFTKFASLLSKLSIKWSPANTGTLLSPTNAAIDGFLKSMGLTEKDLTERPQLMCVCARAACATRGVATLRTRPLPSELLLLLCSGAVTW